MKNIKIDCSYQKPDCRFLNAQTSQLICQSTGMGFTIALLDEGDEIIFD